MEENKNVCSENFTTELLGELKKQNERLAAAIKTSNRSWAIALVAVVAAFLLYLYQYDFHSSIEQKGLYTFVDSEGNVISSDISPEEMERILTIINGEHKDNEVTTEERR